MNQAPGPSAMQSLQQFLQNPLQMFADAQMQWGDVVRFAAMGYEMYQITDPSLAQLALTHPDLEMSVMMEHPFTGHGLANNVGESWKNQRRLTQPSFHRRAISNFGDTIVSSTEDMLNSWQSGTVIDVLSPLMRLNHQILGLSILNLDFYEQAELLHALRTIRQYLNRRFQAIVTVPEFIPTPRNLGFKRAVSLWDAVIRDIIRNNKGEMSILGMLRSAKDPKTDYQMSDDQLRDEINTLFFNGYEDPGATVTWALYLLSQNEKAYTQLREEIRHAIGARKANMSDLGNMPYLDQVINETLRLYPTTWAIMRDALNEVALGEFTIPQGSSIQVTVYLLHRHEGYWADAEQFKPERFAEDYPQEAYMPFGYGARQCIGRAFAMMEMKLVLITILQKFDVEFVSQRIELDGMASLRPKNGMKLRILGVEQA